MLRKIVFLSVLSVALLAVTVVAAVAMVDTTVQAETVEQVAPAPEVAPVQVVEPAAAPVYQKASDGYHGCNYSKARLAEAPVQSVVPDDTLAQAAE